jgi:UDP-hydrolysing UDP-N-acetyl-D-glucosamine 2-epimerase
MHLATVSTSRADSSALEEMAVLAAEAGHKVTEIKSLRNHYVTVVGQLSDALDPDWVVSTVTAGTRCWRRRPSTVMRVPIAHLGGGDVTAGTYDDRMRDAISSLARCHLAGNTDAANRIRHYLARGDDYVDSVGELALRWLDRTELLHQAYVLEYFGLKTDRYILVNWQPETGSPDTNGGLGAILLAFEQMKTTSPILFMTPNDDHGSLMASAMIGRFAREHQNVRIVPSVRRELYGAMMKWCDVMIGNSSSGLIEAPMLGTPFILVGTRQTGRPLPATWSRRSGTRSRPAWSSWRASRSRDRGHWRTLTSGQTPARPWGRR